MQETNISPKIFHEMLELYSALLEVELNISRKRKALGLKIEKDWEELPAAARKDARATVADIAKSATLSPRNDEQSISWLMNRLM